MGWTRSSFLIWLGVAVGTGCSGKYESSPGEQSAGTGGSRCSDPTTCDSPACTSDACPNDAKPGADALGGSGGAPLGTAGSTPSRPQGGTSAYGGSTDAGGIGNTNVILNCGTWVRCDDSSPCATGEDCIALAGCERGICATPSIVCDLNCGSADCAWSPAGLTRVQLSCPTGRIDGFESSAGSGGYPPGYPFTPSCGLAGASSCGGTGGAPAGGHSG
jgi:hypothetical protein